MSLISCFMGKVTWAGRESDIEFFISQVAEQLNSVTMKLLPISSQKSDYDSKLSYALSNRGIFQGYIQSALINSQAQPQIGQLQAQYAQNEKVILFYQDLLTKIKNTEASLQVWEKSLQNRQKHLETVKHLATEETKGMEAMEKQAIQRMAPKVS
jgi:trehalose-6-phosphate synthase